MGILNVTPDSFSDGGKFFDPKNAEAHIQKMISDGVNIIDVGGESTGPLSSDVPLDEELKRVKPVIDFIHQNKFTEKTLFSIDTYKAPVADYALSHGFKMVNDVTALRGDPKMIDVLLKHKPYVVLMYSKDPTPRTTREAVQYQDVIQTIKLFLKERTDFMIQKGFPQDKIVIDPGMGAFVSGDPQYSFEILERLNELKELGFPILIGVSRKSFLGGRVEDRDEASVFWSKKALEKGASIVRLHNPALFHQS